MNFNLRCIIFWIFLFFYTQSIAQFSFWAPSWVIEWLKKENDELSPGVYVCSFDGVLDGIGKKKIFVPQNKEIADYVSKVELDIGLSGYIKVYEAGFITTAGATYHNSKPIIIYNSEKLKLLKLRFNQDEFKLLLKAIFLHELCHDFDPHALYAIMHKNITTDSLKEFEKQADVYMGLRLSREYHVTEDKIKFIVDNLLSNDINDKIHGTKNDRTLQIMAGWRQGNSPTFAYISPIERTVQSAFKINSFSSQPPKGWIYCEQKTVLPGLTIPIEANEENKNTIVRPKNFVEFQIDSIDNRKYLKVRTSKSEPFIKIGRVTDSNIDAFSLRAYDQDFKSLYITKDNKVFHKLNDETYFYLGVLKK